MKPNVLFPSLHSSVNSQFKFLLVHVRLRGFAHALANSILTVEMLMAEGNIFEMCVVLAIYYVHSYINV